MLCYDWEGLCSVMTGKAVPECGVLFEIQSVVIRYFLLVYSDRALCLG